MGVGEFPVDPNQRGLVNKYHRARNLSGLLDIVGAQYKEAIATRQGVIVALYRDFITDKLIGSVSRHVDHPRKDELPRMHTKAYEKTFVAPDGKKRRVTYLKKTLGEDTENKAAEIVAETIKVEALQMGKDEGENEVDRPTGEFVHINFTTGFWEMRDSNSLQTIVNGEPNIIPMGDSQHGSFADILDTYTDELQVLQASTVEHREIERK